MRALKGLLIYIGLVLGMFVGISLILLCVMYFVPSFRIAGYGIVHFNKMVEAQSVDLSEFSSDTVELNVNSNKISVKIVPTDGENITYDMKLDVFGFSSEIVEYKVNKKVEIFNDIPKVFITISEPNGWISSKDSVVTVSVPTTLALNVVVSSNSGNVNIGGDSALNIKSLDVSTNSGDFSIKNLQSTELENVSLSTNSGTFDMRSISPLTVANKMSLTAEHGDFQFGNINASIEITGTDVNFVAGDVVCTDDGFNCIANSISISLDSLLSPVGVENTIIAENLNIRKLTTITGKTGITTTYGDITIGTLNSYTYIDDKYGNVNITTAMDTISVTTYMGNITVRDYKKTGRFTSNRGDINVKNSSTYVNGYYTEINNVDGNVNIENNENKLILKTTGRSNVEIKFIKIKSNLPDNEVFTNDINTSLSGNCIVFIQTNDAPPFMFYARGVISGSLGSTDEKHGLTNIQDSVEPYYFFQVPNAPDNDPAQTKNTVNFNFYGKIEFRGAYFQNI